MSSGMDPKLRRKQILDVAIKIALKRHYLNVTAQEVGEMIGISRPLVVYHFESVPGLQKSVVLRGIDEENPQIIAQVLATPGQAKRFKVPLALRQKALDWLTEQCMK